MKRLIVAGGVHRHGWTEDAPAHWKELFSNDESSSMWLEKEGTKIRRRLQTKTWAAWDGTIPAGHEVQVPEDEAPALPKRRLSGKTQGRYVEATSREELAANATPALEVEEPTLPRRRLTGKTRISVTEGPSHGSNASSSSTGAAVPPIGAGRLPMAKAAAETASEMATCEQCGLEIKRISMMQHLRMYCPKREDQHVPAPRGGRKVLRPPPPVTASEEALLTAKASATGSTMPYVHARWQAKPVPHIPRKVSSLPAPKGEAGGAAKARAKRSTMAPPSPPPEAGCWGGCSGCNQCMQCRKRICNGKCRKCSQCPKCRRWGKMLEDGNTNAERLQAEAVERPLVEKRTVLDPGNMAKLAATADRPKSAAPGARKCPFCEKWLPSYHQENCPSMPYATWLEASK